MQPDSDLEAMLMRRFARPVRGHVHPSDIARRLLADLHERSRDSPTGPLAPNRFIISLSSEDMEQAVPFLAELSADMQRCVADLASSQGLRLLGPPVVLFETGPDLQPGQFNVESRIVEPSAQPSLPADQEPAE
jgi:hypothetical protein